MKSAVHAVAVADVVPLRKRQHL